MGPIEQGSDSQLVRKSKQYQIINIEKSKIVKKFIVE